MVVRLRTRSLPRFVSQQPAGIEPPHAVADQVDRLVAEGSMNLFAQPPSPAIDAGDRLNSRHQHPVAGRFQRLGMPRKYDVSVSGPTPMRVNPNRPWARIIGASRRAKVGWGNIEGDNTDFVLFR